MEQEPQEQKPNGQLMNIIRRSQIFVNRAHDDGDTYDDCAYCKGKRMTDNPETGEKDIEEKDCKHAMVGFTSTKMTTDDLERVFN